MRRLRGARAGVRHFPLKQKNNYGGAINLSGSGAAGSVRLFKNVVSVPRTSIYLFPLPPFFKYKVYLLLDDKRRFLLKPEIFQIFDKLINNGNTSTVVELSKILEEEAGAGNSLAQLLLREYQPYRPEHNVVRRRDRVPA
jgi:hypothetical protein